MPSPTAVINVVFEIEPEFAAEFHTAVVKQAKNSLEKEPWCHQFDVGTDPERPNFFMLYETYDDRDAIVKHRSTEHFADFQATIAEWVLSKQVGIWDIPAA